MQVLARRRVFYGRSNYYVDVQGRLMECAGGWWVGVELRVDLAQLGAAS